MSGTLSPIRSGAASPSLPSTPRETDHDRLAPAMLRDRSSSSGSWSERIERRVRGPGIEAGAIAYGLAHASGIATAPAHPDATHGLHKAQKPWAPGIKAAQIRAEDPDNQTNTAYTTQVTRQNGQLQAESPLVNALLQRARAADPTLDNVLLPEGGADLRLQLDDALQACRVLLSEICTQDDVNVLLPAMMLAQDTPGAAFKPAARADLAESGREPVARMRSVLFEAASATSPDLAGRIGTALNAPAFADTRARFVAHEIYKSLTRKQLEKLPAAFSFGWSAAMGAALDVAGAPPTFEAIDKRFGHDSGAARALKVLYGLMPSFFAESGDATINYALLDTMKDQGGDKGLHAFIARLGERWPDGVAGGSIAATVSMLSSGMQALDGGVDLKHGRGFGALNALINIISSEVQYLGAALPILKQPFDDKRELTGAIAASHEDGLLQLPDGLSAETLAKASLNRDSSNGIAQAAIVPGMALALVYALLGSGRIFRDAPIVPEKAFAALQVATYNPWEALGSTMLVGTSKLGAKALGMKSDDQKYEAMATRIAEDQSLNLQDLRAIDPKYLARAGEKVSDIIGGALDLASNAFNTLRAPNDTSNPQGTPLVTITAPGAMPGAFPHEAV